MGNRTAEHAVDMITREEYETAVSTAVDSTRVYALNLSVSEIAEELSDGVDTSYYEDAFAMAERIDQCIEQMFITNRIPYLYRSKVLKSWMRTLHFKSAAEGMMNAVSIVDGSLYSLGDLVGAVRDMADAFAEWCDDVLSLYFSLPTAEQKAAALDKALK